MIKDAWGVKQTSSVFPQEFQGTPDKRRSEADPFRDSIRPYSRQVNGTDIYSMDLPDTNKGNRDNRDTVRDVL